MKTDIDSLKKTMEERGINISDLAKKIGVDASTLYRKLSAGGEKFTIGEVHRMMEAIPLSRDDANRIFLSINSQ